MVDVKKTTEGEVEKGSVELTEEKLTKALDSLEAVAIKELTPSKSTEETTFVEKAKEESDDIKKGMEVSDFLSDMITQVGESIDNMNELMKSEVTGVHEAVKEIAKSLKDVGEATLQLTQRMTEIEKTPIGVRKSVLTHLEKGIARFGEGDKELNKSQVLTKMVGLVEKGGTIVTTDDVISFENSGKIRPEVEELITA